MFDLLTLPTGVSALFVAGRVGFYLARHKEKVYKRRWEDATKIINSRRPIEWVVDEQIKPPEPGEADMLRSRIGTLEYDLRTSESKLEEARLVLKQQEQKERDRQNYMRGLRDGGSHGKKTKHGTVELPISVVEDKTEGPPGLHPVLPRAIHGATYTIRPATYSSPFPMSPRRCPYPERTVETATVCHCGYICPAKGQPCPSCGCPRFC